MWTGSAHIITAVIGAGVLSLPWVMAQLGWLIGILYILLIGCVTLYTSNLLADCYRSPHPVTGKRSRNYMDAVKTNLGNLILIIAKLISSSCHVILYVTVS